MSMMPPFYLAAAGAAALHSWRTTHTRLVAHHAAGLNPTIGLADLAVYYHCVYQVFGRSPDGALAQQLAQQLGQLPWPEPGCPWASHQVDWASALAWLNAHRVAAGLAAACFPAQLAALDQALYQVGMAVLRKSESRDLLVRVARYLRLRQPAPTAVRCLHALLAHWPEVPIPGIAEPPLLLGLTSGLAAELLVLIRTHQAGVQHPVLKNRLEEGLRHLLALRGGVDFLEQRYSVFPYQVHALAPEGTFSGELSWRRGDLGQSLLLYEAQAVLHDQELANIADLVGLNTLLRTSLSTTWVADPGFYRGAAGVAQLYGELYRISGQPAYCAAYSRWLGCTQDLLATGLLVSAQGEDEPLGGLVGAALVLLAAAEKATPSWWDIII